MTRWRWPMTSLTYVSKEGYTNIISAEYQNFISNPLSCRGLYSWNLPDGRTDDGRTTTEAMTIAALAGGRGDKKGTLWRFATMYTHQLPPIVVRWQLLTFSHLYLWDGMVTTGYLLQDIVLLSPFWTYDARCYPTATTTLILLPPVFGRKALWGLVWEILWTRDQWVRHWWQQEGNFQTTPRLY